MVRLISLEKCPSDFASDVTRATNTQNRIEKRDFAALDKEQTRIKSEMLLSLGKEYVFRTGDAVPANALGCTLDDATVALACAQTDITFSMIAKREVSKLYEDIEQPPYLVLFNPSVSATRVWRAVDDTLKKRQAITEGKSKLIAIHGNRVILHLVFGQLPAVLDDHREDVTQELGAVPETTKAILTRVIEGVNTLQSNAYPSNLFKNVTKCKALASWVIAREGKSPQGDLF
jgi:hypothetical protein